MAYTLYSTPNSGAVGPTMERPLISSVRVYESPSHDHVHIWNRGGKSGELAVCKGDGRRVAEILLPNAIAETVE